MRAMGATIATMATMVTIGVVCRRQAYVTRLFKGGMGEGVGKGWRGIGRCIQGRAVGLTGARSWVRLP